MKRISLVMAGLLLAISSQAWADRDGRGDSYRQPDRNQHQWQNDVRYGTQDRGDWRNHHRRDWHDRRDWQDRREWRRDYHPPVYHHVYVPPRHRYYHHHHHYRPGLVVEVLPPDYRTVIVAGLTYFVLNEIWYQRHARGYMVVEAPVYGDDNW